MDYPPDAPGGQKYMARIKKTIDVLHPPQRDHEGGRPNSAPHINGGADAE
jgi:hypothetical protein